MRTWHRCYLKISLKMCIYHSYRQTVWLFLTMIDIILDYKRKFPIAAVQEHIIDNNIHFNNYYKKKQLLECVKSFNATGICSRRMYNCTFNPIELRWARMKGSIRKQTKFPKFSEYYQINKNTRRAIYKCMMQRNLSCCENGKTIPRSGPFRFHNSLWTRF